MTGYSRSLRAAIRRLPKERLRRLAERALAELAPRARARVVAIDDELVRLASEQGRSPGRSLWARAETVPEGETRRGVSFLLGDVDEFLDESLRGEYYDRFRVGRSPFMYISAGTSEWNDEFRGLLFRCKDAADAGAVEAARAGFEGLFSIAERLQNGEAGILAPGGATGHSFLDRVPRDFFPAYFRCLAATSAPRAFAWAVLRAISDCDPLWRKVHLASARKAARAAQRRALDAAVRVLPRSFE